jgi:enoyl-CoA hydratase
VKLETIAYEVADRIAHLTLSRPERRNAINRTMLREIEQVLDAAEADDAVRVVVVSGAGQSFSSGFDLKEQMEARPEGVETWREILARDFHATMRFWGLRKPTIAAVRGHCLAAGFELALSCDMTVAAEDAVFGEPELKFGAGIVTLLLPWITGPKQAKEIILTGLDSVSAPEALRMGLVNRVVPSGEELPVALALARTIAEMDPMLVQESKRALNRSYELMGMREALAAGLDIDLQIEGQGSVDKRRFMDIARKDGLKAALAWREARFLPGKRSRP